MLSLLILSLAGWGQGIKGYVKDEKGEALPFATIYIKNTESGTTTNIEGYYEVRLAPGTYQVYYQYLGFENVAKEIVVAGQFVNLDITMKSQAVVLKEFTYKARSENPAYTIMRKAISKAKFHELLVKEYDARVYIKGSGRLKDYPWFAKKMIKEEGIDTASAFVSESITDIHFELPNTYKEKVISMRSSGDDQSTSPMSYIQSSFYGPKVVESVSPLAPNAFSYYKFDYLGSFFENGKEVNKIKVIPRVRGEGVFEGFIYINEDLWNIHSLKLSTVQKGIKIQIDQIYAPVKEAVWMPVSYKFFVTGSLLGFDFEGSYVASLSNYKVVVNPDLAPEVKVIDEKIVEKAQLPKHNMKSKEEEAIEGLFGEKEMTRKEMRKTIRKYEKEMIAQEQEENDGDIIVSDRTVVIDSMATKRDTTFWSQIRPVPLTTMELKGYKAKDSIIVAKKEQVIKDSVKEEKRGFKMRKNWKYHPEYVLTGGGYKIGKKSRYEFKPLLQTLGYNTVEGFNARLDMLYTRQDKIHTSIAPVFRYGQASDELYGKIQADFHKNTQFEVHSVRVEGGRYISQYFDENPIAYWLNSLNSLISESNVMKIYEKDYVKAETRQSYNDKIVWNASIEWAQRRELFNNTSYSLFDWERVHYIPNEPLHAELASTSFPEHQALLVSAGFRYEPKVRYKISNKHKSKIEGISPIYHFQYEKGIKGLAGSDVNFDKVFVSYEHTHKAVGRRLDYFVGAGAFLNNKQSYLMDFQHVFGNQTYLFLTPKINKFRLLDYYYLSSNEAYVQLHANQQFRRLLLTNIMELRMLGMHEDIFVNHMQTSNMGYHSEIGYALDGIARIGRFELTAAFRDGKYESWGFRLGFSNLLSNIE